MRWRSFCAVLLLGSGLATDASLAVSTPAPASEWCKRLAARLPGVSVASCERDGLTPSGGKSLQGFPILSRRIASSNRPSGIHGDELTASAIVMQWMQWMQAGSAQDFHWDVMPLVNPDGMLDAKPKRVNAHGVDLNRNFPTPGWKQDAPRYWAKETHSDPRRFPGTAPLSEPETRWINEEMERFRPQVIISVHAPFGVLDFDGPAPTPHRFGRLIFNPVGVYPGSLGNYSGVHKNVPVITIELPNAQTMPSEAEVKRIWQDMLAWIHRNVPQQAITTASTQGPDAPLQRTVNKVTPSIQ
jgi:hypothetical protein